MEDALKRLRATSKGTIPMTVMVLSLHGARPRAHVLAA